MSTDLEGLGLMGSLPSNVTSYGMACASFCVSEFHDAHLLENFKDIWSNAQASIEHSYTLHPHTSDGIKNAVVISYKDDIQ